MPIIAGIWPPKFQLINSEKWTIGVISFILGPKLCLKGITSALTSWEVELARAKSEFFYSANNSLILL